MFPPFHSKCLQSVRCWKCGRTPTSSLLGIPASIPMYHWRVILQWHKPSSAIIKVSWLWVSELVQILHGGLFWLISEPLLSLSNHPTIINHHMNLFKALSNTQILACAYFCCEGFRPDQNQKLLRNECKGGRGLCCFSIHVLHCPGDSKRQRLIYIQYTCKIKQTWITSSSLIIIIIININIIIIIIIFFFFIIIVPSS